MTVVLLQIIENDRYSLEDRRSFCDELMQKRKPAILKKH